MNKIIILLVFSLVANVCMAQFSGSKSFDIEDMMKSDALEQMNSEQLMKASTIPFGNIVEPDYYYVGPGDILMVQNISTLAQKDLIAITPENKIIIPRKGEVDLSGKTLTEAKQIILEKIKTGGKDDMVYVSLYKPRNVIVEISGNVSLPGTYTYPASFKVSTFLKYANQQKSSNMVSMQQNTLLMEKFEKNKQFEEMFANSGLPFVSEYSNRNVMVFHFDGTSEIADFEKAIATNDPNFDPYIREGDKLYVPYNKMDYPLITIAGSIIRPFVTAFKKGDMASMLIKFGGGFRENADLDNIQLILPVSGKKVNLRVDEKLNLISQDVELEPNSMILVGQLQQANIKKSGVVSVVGQVNNPGVYPIKSDESTLKEVIELAGGFTEDAYLPLAYVIRRDESSLDSRSYPFQIMEKFQFSSLTAYDTTRFKIDVMMRQPIVSCDFEDAFLKNIESANITLQDGDIIKIPSNPKTVFVYGQVRNPGYIEFTPNKNMDWYIQQAGGYSETAEEDATRIIRGRTKAWVEGENDVYVFAGDEVYVPAPKNIPIEATFQEVAMWGSIAATALTLINTVNWIFFQ